MDLQLADKHALVTGSGCGIGRTIVVAFLASPLSAVINGDAIAASGGSPRAIHY